MTKGKPFTPKGEVAQWQLVYELLQDLKVGDEITYDELQAKLGRDLRYDRSPFYRARKELEAKRQRSLVVVPDKGYRVITAAEHEGVALGHHRKGRRQLARSEGVLAAADRKQLTPQQVTRFDALQLQISQQRRAIEYLAVRQKRTEDLVAMATGNLEQLERRATKVEVALKRHGLMAEGEDAVRLDDEDTA